MTSAQIIDALGGSASVAALTGAKRTAVSMWRRDGIPARYWPCLSREAAARNVEQVSLEVLERHREALTADVSAA